MGTVTQYRTIRTRIESSVLFLQLYRPEARNAINSVLVEECNTALDKHLETINVVVLEGLPEVFSVGADFEEVLEKPARQGAAPSAEALYNLWSRLSDGPYVSVAHVRGKTTAGGVGFVAACDVVFGDLTAQFTMSEMLFGLYPACVLPFLARRIGLQKASFMTLTTQTVAVEIARAWGLVDACDRDSDRLMARYLARMKLLKRDTIRRYKDYARTVVGDPALCKQRALAENSAMFVDSENVASIFRYVELGLMPWEAQGK
jgi:polyketide biosynthesis enoyl-CoA hydratase PksH